MFLLFPILALFLALWLYRGTRHPKGYPPGPRRWPIVGNFFTFSLTKHWGKQFKELSEKYGKIYSFQFGEFEYVMLADPDDIRGIMNMDEVQHRPRIYYVDFLMNFENVGIVMSEGEPWKEQRRFCLRNLRDFGFGRTSSEDMILDEFKELVAEMRRKAGAVGGRNSSEVPSSPSGDQSFVTSLDRSLNAATANVIWWMTANKKVTENDEGMMRMTEVLEQLASFGILGLISFMPTILKVCPGWLYGQSRLDRLKSSMYGYMQSVIDEHSRTLDESEPRDLVDTFLIERLNRRKLGLGDGHLTDNMLVMTLVDLFNAGNETTATTMRWFFLYMVEYPEIQEKIQIEIDEVVGKSREPRWSDQSKMPYTVAAINELWRIANVIPNGVDHTVSKTITYKGFTIPKDTSILALLYAVHTDPKIWGDPENFRPERFIGPDGKFIKNENLMPFQVGKRQCMGESLARIVVFVGITYLLQLFKFEKVKGESYTFEADVAKSPVISTPFPYKVKLTSRI